MLVRSLVLGILCCFGSTAFSLTTIVEKNITTTVEDLGDGRNEIIISNNGECLNANAQKLNNVLFNYGRYHVVDNRIDRTIWDLLNLGSIGELLPDITPLNMLDSATNRLKPRGSETRRDSAIFVFNPAGISSQYSHVRPYLPVVCAGWDKRDTEERAVKQMCRAHKDNKDLFGLSDFKSTIFFDEVSCTNNKVYLNYQIRIQTNDRHIDMIKEAVLENYHAAGFLSPSRVDSLFNVEKFYRTYFSDLYSVIVESAK